MKYFLYIYAFVVVVAFIILGVPGSKSTKPPLRIFDDMEDQPRYNPQATNSFFSNHMNDRPVVPGTVSRGREVHDVFNPEFRGRFAFSDAYNYGTLQRPIGDQPVEWVKGFPEEVTVDARLLQRGQERFNIFCSSCHGATGQGNGIVTQYGMVGVPDFHSKRLYEMAEGEIFNTITHGKNNMSSYADKLSVSDRWAVIAYVRALQRAFNGSVEDVPADQRSSLGL
jgi:mono/diheme cytochrome c family protein